MGGARPAKQPTHTSHYARGSMTHQESPLMGEGDAAARPHLFVPIPPHLNPLPRRGEEITTAAARCLNCDFHMIEMIFVIGAGGLAFLLR